MNVATWAAIAAAVISAANILVTTRSAGQRERLKWFREELAHSYYVFIDASFRYRHEIGVKYKALTSGASFQELEEIERNVQSCHAALRDAQTKIRVLAPRRVLNSAQNLRDAMDQLHARLSPNTSLSDFDEFVGRTRVLRDEFIDRAKRSLKLRG